MFEHLGSSSRMVLDYIKKNPGVTAGQIGVAMQGAMGADKAASAAYGMSNAGYITKEIAPPRVNGRQVYRFVLKTDTLPKKRRKKQRHAHAAVEVTKIVANGKLRIIAGFDGDDRTYTLEEIKNVLVIAKELGLL